MAPEIAFNARRLKRAAMRMKNKAGGTDAWEGKHWACLPESAFEPLAQLWTDIWNGADPPEQWWHVKMAFIPRQIGIAQMAWRLGLKVVMDQLAD